MSSATTLPLGEMSHADKLRVMEELWDDLCHSAEDLASPAWHGEVLAERARRAAPGAPQFREWHEVKDRLLKPRE